MSERDTEVNCNPFCCMIFSAGGWFCIYAFFCPRLAISGHHYSLSVLFPVSATAVKVSERNKTLFSTREGWLRLEFVPFAGFVTKKIRTSLLIGDTLLTFSRLLKISYVCV
jgi:hypothetical protein